MKLWLALSALLVLATGCALGFFLAAISLHVLAMPAAVLMLIPLLFARRTRVPWPVAVAVTGALSLIAWFYRREVVREPVIAWRRSFNRTAESRAGSDLIDPGFLAAPGATEWVLIGGGIALGLWLGWRLARAVRATCGR